MKGDPTNFGCEWKKDLNEYDAILKQEELDWFQQSRTKWIQDGDRNTRFQHLKTINIRKRNKILMLRNT